MPIPSSREELLDQLKVSYASLEAVLTRQGDAIGHLSCIDDWTVKDVLAVRAWWAEHVVDWVEVGFTGANPTLPAPGFKWNETPRLNASIVRSCREEPYDSVHLRLRTAFQRSLAIVDRLTDRELLEIGVFAWAGKWPVSRWLSINTVRQFTTARALIRRASLDAENASQRS